MICIAARFAITLPEQGPGPAVFQISCISNISVSAAVLAVLWARTFIWTAIPCHSRVCSYCSKTDLCPPYSCGSRGCCRAAHVKGILQDPSPTSGHPWAPLHRPGCLADAVGLFLRRVIRVLAYFTSRCVPLCVVVNTQKEVAGCSWGWVSHLNYCHLVCKCHVILSCSVLWEFVNNGGNDGAYRLQWAQEGIGHTKTKWAKFAVPLELLELMKMWQRF